MASDDHCDCEAPGYYYSGLPGVVCHVSGPNPDPSEAEYAQHCDHCQRYKTDEAARAALSQHIIRGYGFQGFSQYEREILVMALQRYRQQIAGRFDTFDRLLAELEKTE